MEDICLSFDLQCQERKLMPTLFRMLLVLILLGGGFLGFLAYLGSSPEPVSELVSVDVTSRIIGKGSGS